MSFLARLVFDFNRNVMDIFVEKLMAYLVLYLFRIRSLLRDNMCRDRVFGRRKRPDVYVVDSLHSGYLREIFFDFGNVQSRRYAVEIHEDAFFQKIHDAHDHDDGDYDGDDRIDRDVSGEINDGSSDHDPERNERVSEEVEICGLHIYILFVATHQKPSGKPVYEDSHPCDRHHGRSDRFHRLGKADECLIDDVKSRNHEQDGIDERRKYTRTFVSVGEGFRALHLGRP